METLALTVGSIIVGGAHAKEDKGVAVGESGILYHSLTRPLLEKPWPYAESFACTA